MKIYQWKAIKQNIISCAQNNHQQISILAKTTAILTQQKQLRKYDGSVLTTHYIMSKLKQKHIEQFLQDMQDFQFGQKDKMHLQQHMTPPDLAAQLLFHIYHNQPIEDMLVADLGVGTGMLICGLVYIGALYALGVQFDQKYAYVGQKQLEQKVEGGNFQIIRADVSRLKLRPKKVDLVVMNPPFGTKQENIDSKFLQMAMQICNGNIYSMHKSSTRAYLLRFGEERGYKVQLVIEADFPLKKRFKGYHKKDLAFTQVDVLKFTPVKVKQKQEGISFKE